MPYLLKVYIYIFSIIKGSSFYIFKAIILKAYYLVYDFVLKNKCFYDLKVLKNNLKMH